MTKMTAAMKTLLSVASESLLSCHYAYEHSCWSWLPEYSQQLLALLQQRNGFFAFRSALHVFPIGESDKYLTLSKWNNANTWRSEYGKLVGEGDVFFAQDAFGNQFVLRESGVYVFWSEFAEFELYGSSIADWCEQITGDWRDQTGYEWAESWQTIHGPLKEGYRLIPKVPFVVGGKFEISNLYSGRIVDAMRFRASLALQIAEMPDGTRVRLKVKRDE